MTPNKQVCTRIAPSPTGDPHIGTAYTALFNYVFAKHHGGRFILRIEDTDQTRSTAASEKAIFDALKWVGIPWDEGPDIGGPCGPYRQSERTDIYRQHIRQLVESGHAYPCFCTAERLTELRQQQMAAKDDPRYDGHCLHVTPEEAQQRIDAGEPHVIRLKVPAEGRCVMPERLRGEVIIEWKMVDHQVLQKTDGFPTYHLANVVDDHLMGVTHVIRGEEWISSLPKHFYLYEAFGWEPPEFIHMPLLRNPDKSKLSKRKNPTSISYYRESGILPQAVRNYLGMMAYTLPSGEEMFTMEEMAASFSIDRISMGGPVFDQTKLRWLNGRYLREQMTSEQVLEELKKWKLNDAIWLKIIPLAQKRLEALSDLMPLAGFLFADRLEYSPLDLVPKKLEAEQVVPLLRKALWALNDLRQWDVQSLKDIFERMSEQEELKLKQLLPVFFVAVCGKPVSLPLFDSMELLGKDMVQRRLQYALEALATAGYELKGKPLKALEKEYRLQQSSRR